MANLYIIAGCNGAGKTTASYTILPDMLHCKHFVNADEIARGLSPFDVESVAIQAGKIMFSRIEELIELKEDFAIETTLATRSYIKLIDKAHLLGYIVHLLFFYIESVELAKLRVAKRVSEGGHNVAEEIIERRYKLGINNLINLFIPRCDSVLLVNKSVDFTTFAEKKTLNEPIKIVNQSIWDKMLSNYERK